MPTHVTTTLNKSIYLSNLSIAGPASYIIFKENLKQKNYERRTFLKALCLQLCLPLISTRTEIPRVISKFAIRSAMESLLGHPISLPESRPANVRQEITTAVFSKCHVCLTKKVRKSTRTRCTLCSKGVCKAHQTKLIACETCNFTSDL